MEHIKSLQIKNFKGIKELELKQLNLINFLVGESGSCKTTILDAIRILENPTNIGRFADTIRIVERNKYILSSFKELIHGKYSPTLNNKFEIFFNGNHLEFEVEFEKKNRVSIKLSDEDGNVTSSSETSSFPIFRLPTDKAFERRKNLKHEGIIVNTFSNKKDIDYEKVINIPDVYKVILTILQQTNSNITQISISKKDKKVVVFDKALNKNIPIELMGNGILGVIELLSLIVYSKGAVLLLEDWDNYFSKNTKKVLYPVVKKLIVDLNVQVFFTTYSEETLLYMLDEKDSLMDKIMIYTIYKEGTDNYVRRLNGADALKASTEYGLSLI